MRLGHFVPPIEQRLNLSHRFTQINIIVHHRVRRGRRENKKFKNEFYWWAVLDLNQRLPPCEDGTLTTELTALL